MKSAAAFPCCTACIHNIKKCKADYYRQAFHHATVKAANSIISFTNICKVPANIGGSFLVIRRSGCPDVSRNHDHYHRHTVFCYI